VLDKYDLDTLKKQLIDELAKDQDVKSPVKIFINCKNSRSLIQPTPTNMNDSLFMGDSLLFNDPTIIEGN
jgi:hypothetical protein